MPSVHDAWDALHVSVHDEPIAPTFQNTPEEAYMPASHASHLDPFLPSHPVPVVSLQQLAGVDSLPFEHAIGNVPPPEQLATQPKPDASRGPHVLRMLSCDWPSVVVCQLPDELDPAICELAMLLASPMDRQLPDAFLGILTPCCANVAML